MTQELKDERAAEDAGGDGAALRNFSVSKEWLADRLARGEEPGGLMACDPSFLPSCLCCSHVGVPANKAVGLIDTISRLKKDPGRGDEVFRCGYNGAIDRVLSILAATQPSAEEQPSLTNPLTPYGMLVRALRIVAGTTLYDMAKHFAGGSARLSAIEFGRMPATEAVVARTAEYFAGLGIRDTLPALNAALLSAAPAEAKGGKDAD
jgi:hypothetical protein